MLIGENWKIEADNHNVVISQQRINQVSKKPYWTVEGFFSNIPNALVFLADQELHATGLTDIETVVKKQGEIYRLIETLKL